MNELFLSEANAPKPSKADTFKHLVISLAIVAIVGGACTEIYNLIPHGPKNALEGAQACMDQKAIEREYLKLVNSDFFNLDNHRGYLAAHTSIPKVKVTKSSTITRDDSGVIKQYTDYTLSPDPKTKDIGYYGLGYFYVQTKDSDKALDAFSRVSDPNMPYLNNSIGNVYLVQKKRPDLAKDYFLKEISLKGNIKGAVSNLTSLYLDGHKWKELSDLMQDPALGPLVGRQSVRYWDLWNGKPWDYLINLLDSESSDVSFMTVLAGLVIALMFLTYIYFIDVFEKEEITLLLYIFLLGIASAVLATVFYDLAGCFLHFSSTGDMFHDFFFYIFGVGIFEETAKVLPVLIAVYGWKKWNEPVDILIFAAVSALGFACLENAGYFNSYAISLIIGRTVSAVVLHVCMTCMAVYGIFVHRHKKSAMSFLAIPFYFFLAVLAHGLYDFCASSTPGIGFFSIVVLVLMMICFRNMIENGLGLADFKANGPLTLNLTLYLIYGLLGILLMQFAILDIQYGPDLSISNMEHSLVSYYFLFFVLVSDFGRIKIVKGKWRPLLDQNKT